MEAELPTRTRADMDSYAMYVQIMKQAFTKLMQEETWSVTVEAKPKILRSAEELFLFFERRRLNLIRLDNNRMFFDLFTLFQTYLGQYVYTLMQKLVSVPGPGTIEGQTICCLILNTAEYCRDMSKLLQDEMRKDISDGYRSRISFLAEMDRFHLVRRTAMEKLIVALNGKMTPAFTALILNNWDVLQEPIGDTSLYVSTLCTILNDEVPIYRVWLEPNLFRPFYNLLMDRFMSKFHAAVLQCAKISECGANQLRKDLSHIKTVLESVPQLGVEDVDTTSSIGHGEHIEQAIKPLANVITLLLTPVESLVDTVSLFPEISNSRSNILKILQVRGLPYSLQAQILQACTPATHDPTLAH